MNAILRVQLLMCVVTCAFADEAHFPVKSQAGEAGVSGFQAEWYGKILQRMKEPLLTDAVEDADAVIFRLTIVPTWGNPTAVRVQKHERIYTLSARRLDGAGGYDPGKLVEQKDIQMSEDDSEALDVLIANLKFFEMPTDDGVRLTDGDDWILEGVSGGKYHVVQRKCASHCNSKKRGLTAFIALCRFLIDKSTLSERPKNKGRKLI